MLGLTEKFEIIILIVILFLDDLMPIETEKQLDEIQLVNSNGQMIQKIDHPKANKKVYTLDNLNRGVYFLKLNSSYKSKTHKIIIN